jgi:hypothetical protein
MQKVYLLLRNNQQTGPYNLEQLLQFDLKPYDLIWIEGRSAGWYYPQEIKALHPYLPFVQKQTQPIASNAVQPQPPKTEAEQPKKVFVSMPLNTIREEPAPKTSSTNSPGYQAEVNKFSEPVHQQKEVEELKTFYARRLEDVEADYTNWIYQKKTKKKSVVSKKGVIAACLIVGVAFGGWWAVNTFSATEDKNVQEQTSFLPAQNELSQDSVLKTDVSPTAVSSPTKKLKQNKVSTTTKRLTDVNKQEIANRKTTEPLAANTSVVNNDYEAAPVEERKEIISEEKVSEPAITEAPKEQKKKLREKISDLFKKKPGEKKNGEAKSAQEEDGQRSSTRREAGANLADLVSVRFTVPNDWMMGIKGAKITLNNRSSETIVKATVEVLYYNDDNELLDKRSVSFTNIQGKKAQTISIPDHSTATRMDYKIVSVVGAHQPFAKL